MQGTVTTRRSFAIALVYGVVSLVLILSSSWNDSPCFDEPEHITAGYTYVGFGIHFMNPFHPPLVKDLAGLSVQTILNPPALKTWWERDTARSIEELFSGEVLDVQRLTRVARLPIIFLSSCFVAIFFLMVEQEFGRRVALMAATMLALSPTFLAHAGFVHTDVGAAATCFLSLWFLARYLQNPPSLGRALAFALVSGTAVLVKFSCLVLAPVYLLSVTLVKDRVRRWKHVPVVALSIMALIWLVYSVHPNSVWRHTSYLRYHFRTVDKGVVGLVHDAGMTRLAPLARYATGVLVQGRHVGSGHEKPSFLSGRVYYGGSWSFFPLVVLTKVPLGFLVLALLALRGIPKRLNLELKLYLGFVLLYSAVALSASINLGIRHLLPLFPPCLVLLACGLDLGLSQGKNSFRRAVQVAFVLALLGNLSAWPRYLRYFNLLSLGRIPVVDSNYDWGTDLYRLAQRAQEKEWDPLYLQYFGGALPHAYLGERHRPLRLNERPESGWVAISQSLYLPLVEGDDSALPSQERAHRDEVREWLASLEEVEVFGTFRVFRVEK